MTTQEKQKSILNSGRDLMEKLNQYKSSGVIHNIQQVNEASIAAGIPLVNGFSTQTPDA